MAIRIGSSPVVPGPASQPDADAPKPPDAPKPDAFNAKAGPNLAMLSQGKAPLHTPKELGGDLSKLSQAAEVPHRFGADVAIAKNDLVNHPALTQRDDKAQRLFDFAVPYAQKVVELKATPEVMNQFLQAAQANGYQELHNGQKDGVHALKELLNLPSDKIAETANAMRFDAPSWPQVPLPITATNESDKSRNEDDGERHTTHKRLGRNMLWNALHLFRSDGEDDRESAKQREEKNQLALVAALVLVFLAIIVVVLATL
jgi:hypothetical protein